MFNYSCKTKQFIYILVIAKKCDYIFWQKVKVNLSCTDSYKKKYCFCEKALYSRGGWGWEE